MVHALLGKKITTLPRIFLYKIGIIRLACLASFIIEKSKGDKIFESEQILHI